MLNLKGKTLGILLGVAATGGLASPALAAPYFTTDTWYQGLSDAAQDRGSVILSPLQSYQVKYTDFYGSWTTETQGELFPVGPEAHYNFPPGTLISRTGTISEPGVVPGSLGAVFTCYSPLSRCVGALSVTFTLPFEIIGLSGMLDVRADYWPSSTGIFMPELGINSLIAGTDWKFNSPDTFYGNLFALPTNTITVSWGVGGYGSDNGAGFTLNDVMLVRAPTAVPEPASAAVLVIGILGLAAGRWRVRRSSRPSVRRI